MKTHLGLAVLACILVFGCTAMKKNDDPRVIQTTAQQSGYTKAAQIKSDNQCKEGSVKCNIIITLDLKDKSKDKVEVYKYDDDGKSKKLTPVSGMSDPTKVIGFGQILYTSSSPGCIYFYYAGDWWYICE